MRKFTETLESLKAQGRYRILALPDGADLTSNDYLGMAAHPALRCAAIEALEGGIDLGAAGSRLLRGHTQAHESLEAYAADYFGAERALYFSSGFQANLALFTSLADRHDAVIYDSLIHASVREGLQAGRARAVKFAHNDLNDLEDKIKLVRDQAQNLFIAVESVYSMDGDVAPLPEIMALARRYDAVVIVDEAHASGIYGERGRGFCWDIVQAQGYENLITLHTCGKAIGVAGGLVCAEVEVIDYMINCARPFIYSTAPMPLQALLVQKSLEVLDTEDGQARRGRLFEICARAKALLGGPGTQVVPVILGTDERAVAVAKSLQAEGFDVRAIRPPSVPEGTARLRVSLSSELAVSELERFAALLTPHLAEERAA
ncbi:MAG: 8-amino-7-oxononanoate synthase [Alphaproteobacteria bacterium]|nr:8-amino-7-oxononanoate synthase [Alphaproteobacteria bacterium]